MLERLVVSGLGIIDAVEVELTPGFVALTGETGAGKSLLVTSLELLGGRRATSDLVRTGDDRLRVEGWFKIAVGSRPDELLDELGVAVEDVLVIRRELSAAGRGRCWVNDVSVTAASLQRIAPSLLSIHGQHEQHGLADAQTQRRLVDDAGGHARLLVEVGDGYSGWREAADVVAELEEARAHRRDRLDTIAFQLGEIDGVGPTDGELERLTARRQVLRNAARLRELAASVLGSLGDDETSVIDRMARAERDVEEMAAHGLPLTEVRVLTDDVEGDPGELDGVESRLHALDQLMLKYGEPLAKVLEHREALVVERQRLEEVEDRLEAAVADAEAALGGFADAAERLDEARRNAGAELARSVERVLGRLNMEGTRLEFRWQPRVDHDSPLVRNGVGVAFDRGGVEECELLIAANPGEEPRPMARIASGGELSRIHLALRTVLREARPGGAATLLFDEVDSGLGGATAAALAALLADLARSDQVLAVTHLPQVAAAAGSHLRIDKVRVDERSVTRVVELEGEDREIELARMLAGEEIGSSARAHARALLGKE
jgi:DNA repair protein RecN (Recombination protein N)